MPTRLAGRPLVEVTTRAGQKDRSDGDVAGSERVGRGRRATMVILVGAQSVIDARPTP